MSTVTAPATVSLIDRQRAVRREVLSIRNAWPQASISWGTDRLAAVAMIHDANVTQVIEVTSARYSSEADSRSLWVKHAAGSGTPPQWREGWID